jgi:hypothetical protein
MGILHELLQLSEVLGDRFRGMRESSVRLHVDCRQLAAEELEQYGHEHAAGSAHAIQANSETAVLYSWDIEERQGKNLFDVLARGILVGGDGAQPVPRRSGDITVNDSSHVGRFGAVEEQPGRPDELEGIPLNGVVTRGDCKTARRAMVLYGELNGRSRHHSDIEDVAADGLERRVDHGLKHRTRNATVAAYDDRRLATAARQRPGAKSGGEFGHDLRRERFADSPAHTGDAHHQSFIGHSRFSSRCYWDDGAARNLLAQKFIGRQIPVSQLINFPLNILYKTGE